MLSIPRPCFAGRLAPVLALIVACSLWGTADAATKVALQSFSPPVLTMLRFAVAALVLIPTRKVRRDSFRSCAIMELG